MSLTLADALRIAYERSDEYRAYATSGVWDAEMQAYWWRRFTAVNAALVEVLALLPHEEVTAAVAAATA